MDLSNATPEQITDYKNAWRQNGFQVLVGSNMDVKGKDWCRHNLTRWSWSMEAFADAGHHKFLFEHEQSAADFAEEFGSTIGHVSDAESA